MSFRGSARLVAALLSIATFCGVFFAPSAPASAALSDFEWTPHRTLVDDAARQVYVMGEGEGSDLIVFDFTGTEKTTLPNLGGPAALFGETLLVAPWTRDTVEAVDTRTLKTLRSYPLAPYSDVGDVAFVAGRLWFAAQGPPGTRGIAALDLVTGVTAEPQGVVPPEPYPISPQLLASPSEPDVLFVHGSYGSELARYRVTPNQVLRREDQRFDGSQPMVAMAIAPSGDSIYETHYGSMFADTVVPETDALTLAPTGREIRYTPSGDPNPQAIATARNVVAVGSTKIRAFAMDDHRQQFIQALSGSRAVVPNGLGLSADGSTIFAVTHSGGSAPYTDVRFHAFATGIPGSSVPAIAHGRTRLSAVVAGLWDGVTSDPYDSASITLSGIHHGQPFAGQYQCGWGDQCEKQGSVWNPDVNAPYFIKLSNRVFTASAGEAPGAWSGSFDTLNGITMNCAGVVESENQTVAGQGHPGFDFHGGCTQIDEAEPTLSRVPDDAGTPPGDDVDVTQCIEDDHLCASARYGAPDEPYASDDARRARVCVGNFDHYYFSGCEIAKVRAESQEDNWNDVEVAAPLAGGYLDYYGPTAGLLPTRDGGSVRYGRADDERGRGWRLDARSPAVAAADSSVGGLGAHLHQGDSGEWRETSAWPLFLQYVLADGRCYLYTIPATVQCPPGTALPHVQPPFVPLP